MLSSLTTLHRGAPVQEPFDAAVVMTTTCRPSLVRAVSSVFRQVGVRRIQVLIGIDVVRGDPAVIDEIEALRPPGHAVTVFNLGYSTSVRHGGIHPAGDGGSLRTILTYAANSRFVAYLDDDNWLHETHIARLLAAAVGKDWAYTLRWFVDPDTLQPLAVDRWESAGPGQGAFAERFGGFVDPNCLMIDKLKCDFAIRGWALPMSADARARTADRTVFDGLRRLPAVGFTNAVTTYYVLAPVDDNSIYRLSWMREYRRYYGEAAVELGAQPPIYGGPFAAAPSAI
ncbi:MAG TPA: glycosyltransferase family 2 protein [Stellaceae bacterium]|nr:glycosyltransferase family 2 protein [Stellaceae bacterium]